MANAKRTSPKAASDTVDLKVTSAQGSLFRLFFGVFLASQKCALSRMTDHSGGKPQSSQPAQRQDGKKRDHDIALRMLPNVAGFPITIMLGCCGCSGSAAVTTSR